MRISVKVIPNAKKEEVVREGDKLKVHAKAPAVSGKANKVVIELLADFFKIKKNAIRIVKGERSREKIIEILQSI